MPAPRTRKPTRVRRREIADAVLGVIGEQGASSLTAATVAQRVGVTPGALFRHFDSVAEMLQAAVERAVEAAEETFPEAGTPPLDRLLEIAAARIALCKRTRGVAWLLLSDQVYLTVPEAGLVRLRALVRRTRRYLLDALREGVADGAIRSDIPPEVLLVLFTGTVHASIGLTGIHAARPRKGRPPTPTHVLDALRILLRPCATPDPTSPEERR